MKVALAGDRILPRVPTLDVSQPCAGQIDGVAAARALRLSTSTRTELSRLSMPCSSSRSRPNVFSGDCSAGSAPMPAALAVAAAHRAVLDDRGQLVHRRLQGRIERGLRAELGDRRLQALNLTRERFGGDAVVAVLDFERRRRRVERGDVALGLERGAGADEHRQRQHAAHGHERRPQANVNRRTTPVRRSATTMVYRFERIRETRVSCSSGRSRKTRPRIRNRSRIGSNRARY